MQPRSKLATVGLLLPILFVLVLPLVGLHAQANEDESNSGAWEYEPRIWDPEKPANDITRDISNSLHLEEFPIDDLAEEETSEQSSSANENPHMQHNYLGPDVALKQQSGSDTPCTQFRVDIREAVVCDKKRCDKFDFEWPKYDNQLVVIETTKHGMRFHRADFAFAASKSSIGQQVRQEQMAPTKTSKPKAGSNGERVKFDLFDFLKPSSTTTTTTTTMATTAATTSTTTSTSTSTTNTTTTTATPTPQPSTTSNTAAASNSTTQPPPSTPITPPDADTSSQDTNNTQLVATLRLDTRRRLQQMVGFGGALSDSTCRNIKSLSPEMANNLMEDYYGDRGLRYNLVRMTIGSSDFSTKPYTNNDASETNETNNLRLLANEGDDVEMNNFRLTEEDYEYKLPVARQAIATSRQEVKFFASLWSPPVWMKNNSHIVHGYLKGDVYGPYYRALAELMLKWLEAYKRNGIQFWGMTGLNEPVTGVKPFIFHNSLGMSKSDYITFFKLYLGPMMRQRGFENVKLMILDDNKGYAPFWVKAFLEDQEAAKYISGVAMHWYMNDEYENLNFIAKNYPDKFIISTEACNGYLPFQVHTLPGNWDRGVAYMYDIIKMIQKSSVGWVDWNMALDLGGGPSWANNNLDAPIIVNAKRDEYYKSPMFYAMGHFSRFVESNSSRLDHRLANAKYDQPLETVAFYTPKDYIVIVVLNANRHPVPFKVVVNRQLIRVVTLRADSFNTIVFKWKNTTN